MLNAKRLVFPSTFSYNILFTTDETFTIANIMEMIKEVDKWEKLGILIGIYEPKYKFDKIKQEHKDPQAQKEEMIRWWYDTHPLVSWSLLHQALSMMGETEAAQEIQEKFLQGMNLLIVYSVIAIYM